MDWVGAVILIAQMLKIAKHAQIVCVVGHRQTSSEKVSVQGDR